MVKQKDSSPNLRIPRSGMPPQGIDPTGRRLRAAIDRCASDSRLGLLLYYQILARIPSATPLLTKTLSTAHPIIRARVVEILGISKDKTAIPALLDALKGEYFTVRSPAALALANIGDVQVLPALLPLLKDRESEVRNAACVAVAKFCVPSTFDDITTILLDDPIMDVRRSAARALGDTKHPAALPFLMEALRDSSWWFEQEEAAADLLIAI
ncbi:HEAT repeat domain-containing protein, partial [Candidatus Villigracilis saccharophilus]|uniref:HEAT repeat domain-containing protein n=1 Tax=Candidatus Villigracilis saccharophilus TaxID=3140684 RepID=UPI00313509A6|nr:HEAT repeat domain-containing protein [Anaerolineales bacterium]